MATPAMRLPMLPIPMPMEATMVWAPTTGSKLFDFDDHESHIPMYEEANKDITELQSILLNYLELKENINTKIEETKINLPEFSLPSFKGDLGQWLDFKTTFEDTIINNSSLNNIQKFKYLQSSLSGDAASIIKGFSLTPGTFDKAWLALNERYHCTRDLAYKYCNNILNIKYIKVTNSRNIIELIDTVKLNLRNLELLGIDEEQLGNMLLTTFILKKIDSNMNKDFELSLKENTFPTLQDLLTFLEKHRKGLDHINGKIYPKEDNVRKTFKTYQGPRDSPSAMNSKLGWIISGRSNMPNNTTSTSIQQIHVNHSSAELDDIVKKFWDAESIPTHKEELNTEELECENIFRTTTFRDENGRYVVSLPFKLNYNKINYQLGDSKSQALRRFLSLERRFHQKPVYSQHVREFMQEYLNLGHMEVINEIEPEQLSHQVYYMPYHAVLRDQSTTTKLRVVFDASARTSTGLSLNDLLYCGPKLQEDIFNILIKFRTYSIALTADIEKMYRQIRLNPADCCFQRILWRASPNEPIKEYQLATVTYGTTSAPYLAIKTLKTLAHDEQEQFPQASKAILTNFYVDDMLSGANSVEEAKDLIIKLNQIMRRGGLIWNTIKDVFQVKVQDTMDVKTKRQLLSVIAQFFDPLGIISPSIILLKILMQDAWKLQLDWDDYLPDDIVNLWAQFKKDIGYLSQVMIPRYLAIIPKEDEVRMQLHGFADASAKAYAAVCYLRCETQNDVKIQLLAAKTRVASLKAPTLPCLELCAAHLLSQLVDSIKLTLPFQIKETFLWTDSKITLCWIQSNPSKWKVYISNRVEKIKKTSRVDQWHHVPGVVNPADCASRGLMPSKLVDHYLWWNGPSWLTTFDLKILSNKASVVEESEIVQSYGELIQIHYSSAEDVKTHSLPDSITRFSSYNRMKRTLAWCLRFFNNSRYPSNKFSGTLTTKEIRSSELKITKVVQECYFSVEINALLSSKALPKTNKLLCLNPFIDQNGILRVGGRLKLSSLSEFQKHPIILPPKSHVTELIIRQCHQEHFHSSFNLTCSILRRTYWIVNGRSFVKQILKNCFQCFKVNARPNTQLMGELPSSRTTYIRSFARTGVDLAGPILTKPRLPRSRVKLKSYIALFVCFATKAIHLELVSDLSTGSFIAALRRFTSRRGTPSDIYSDNGTNFKGAAKFLNEQYALLHASEIQDYITYSEINWHFMPPHAPQFGGIWESNIKSVKMILKKVIGSSLLTFEEFTTFLTQIEATLNQRPLTPLSEDPNDLEALTPAHFLSGPSTYNLPETDNQQANLSSYEVVSKILWSQLVLLVVALMAAMASAAVIVGSGYYGYPGYAASYAAYPYAYGGHYGLGSYYW
ncbi:hypothetical protein LAZ67_21002170, partial [Cordylochernes scorpioides]